MHQPPPQPTQLPRTVCQSLLANLQSRGLRTDRSLFVILHPQQIVGNLLRHRVPRLAATLCPT
jgi:hypothetical protein